MNITFCLIFLEVSGWLSQNVFYILIHSGNTYLECVENCSFTEYFYEVLGRFYCTCVMIFGCSHNLTNVACTNLKYYIDCK